MLQFYWLINFNDFHLAFVQYCLRVLCDQLRLFHLLFLCLEQAGFVDFGLCFECLIFFHFLRFFICFFVDLMCFCFFERFLLLFLIFTWIDCQLLYFLNFLELSFTIQIVYLFFYLITKLFDCVFCLNFLLQNYFHLFYI